MDFGGHRNDDSFKPLLFRRWGSNLDSHRKFVLHIKVRIICLQLSKHAVKHRSLYHKPLSQSATVVLQNCDDEVMKRYPISTNRRIPRRQIIPLTALALKWGVCFLHNHRPELGRWSERRTIHSPSVYSETRCIEVALKRGVL